MSRTFYRGLTIAMVMLGGAAGFAAVPTVTTAPVDVDSTTPTIDIGVESPRSPRDQAPGGNPLWAIPLSELSATRERPIFSPSRRPPPPAVAAAPYVLAQAVSKPVEPDRPRLSLVGTIASARESFGIFLDQTTNKIVRLKMGEGHQGWILRHVRGREVMLQKNQATALLVLPAVTAVAGPAGAPSAPRAEESNGGRSRR
jgi:hypothetical protein